MGAVIKARRILDVIDDPDAPPIEIAKARTWLTQAQADLRKAQYLLGG